MKCLRSYSGSVFAGSHLYTRSKSRRAYAECRASITPALTCSTSERIISELHDPSRRDDHSGSRAATNDSSASGSGSASTPSSRAASAASRRSSTRRLRSMITKSQSSDKSQVVLEFPSSSNASNAASAAA